MPALAFLAVAGLALLALMLVADATLEKSAPLIITSSRVGLPERWHSDDVEIFTTTLTPEPDITSPAVRAAQQDSDHEALSKIAPAARAARAEAPPENKLVKRRNGYQQNQWRDRLSIGGQ